MRTRFAGGGKPSPLPDARGLQESLRSKSRHGHIVPCPAAEVLVRRAILVRDRGVQRATRRLCCVSLNPFGVDVEFHRGHGAKPEASARSQVRREAAHAARVEDVSAGIDAHRAAGREVTSAECRSPGTDLTWLTIRGS